MTADVDASRGNANEIIAAIEADAMPRLLADFPEIRYSLEVEQQQESLRGLIRGSGIAPWAGSRARRARLHPGSRGRRPSGGDRSGGLARRPQKVTVAAKSQPV